MKHIFDKNIIKSKGIDNNGESYNFDFRVQNGKINYEKIEEELYIVKYTVDNPLGNTVETRHLTFDQLSEWFYNPSEEYYLENIKKIKLIEDN